MSTVEHLLQAEQIRLVKHRFLRFVDLKRWDDLCETITENATLETGARAFGKSAEITGRQEIVEFLRARLGPDTLTGHVASQSEITVEGEVATGVWAHRQTVVATGHRMIITSTGFSEERYERGADGRWRIGRIGYLLSYEVMASLDDLPSFKVIAALGGELAAHE
jgi:hypothetical protein